MFLFKLESVFLHKIKPYSRLSFDYEVLYVNSTLSKNVLGICIQPTN